MIGGAAWKRARDVGHGTRDMWTGVAGERF